MRWNSLALAVALAAAGCGAQVTVVHRAEPNPFAGRNRFWIEPLDVGGAAGETTEAARALAPFRGEAVVDRADLDVARATQVLRGILHARGIAGNLTDGEARPADAFVIRPSLVRLDNQGAVTVWRLFPEPGVKVIVELRVVVAAAGGSALDEVWMRATSTGNDIYGVLQDLADALGAFLRRRLAGAGSP